MKRRHFLRRGREALAALAGLASFKVAATDSTKTQGLPAREYGQRSRFEKIKRFITPGRMPTETASWTPLGELHGVITPSALHYERHHAGIPDLDPNAHQLLIHGLVERPLVFSMEDLMRFPEIHRICFLECSGNTYTEWRGPSGKNVQQSHGLTSCSDWAGVALGTLLKEAGLANTGKWVVAEGADGAAMTRSIPIEKCLDDVIVAYSQNGEALRPEQGYPLRLLVPGYEGSISVKWLRRLKVTAEPYHTREETSKYTDLMPDGKAREFTFTMEAKSVITNPSPGQNIKPGAYQQISGLAWSGRGRVSQVEVSVDGGRSWHQAQIEGPVLPICHTRFHFDWHWDGTPTSIMSRCTDETGYTQPTREALISARGTNSFYHYNAIQTWHIAETGSVNNG